MADTYAIKGGFQDGYYEGPMTISTNWGVTQNCYADSSNNGSLSDCETYSTADEAGWFDEALWPLDL